MSLKNSLIKNTGYNLLGYVYLLVASFFSVSLLLQNLGRDIFGVYILLISFISIASVFDFGISSAVIRKLSLPQTSREEKVTIWKTSFAIYISIALVLFVGIIAILLWLSNHLPILIHLDRTTLNWSIALLACIVFINHLNNHLLNLPQALQRFDIFNSKTLLVGTANTIISAIVSGIYPNIAVLFAVQLAFHILTFIYMISYSLKLFPGTYFGPSFDRQTGKYLFSFGYRNFIGTLAGQIESQFSNFMLGAMVSARAITSFSIPQSIVTKGAGVVSQFAQAFFPLSASLLEKDRIKKLKSLVIGVESLALLGGVLAVTLSFTIGQSFLMWWLKDAVVVETAFPVLKVLSFYFLLVALTPVPTALLQGLDKPQIPSFFAVLTVAIEISLAFFLVPAWGVVGMAYSFLGSVSFTVPVFLLITYIQLEREIKKTQSPV